MPIRIFVVDRQQVVRSGLALACSSAAGIEVVGEASSLVDSQQTILSVTVDVLIVDLNPQHSDELEALRRLRAERASMRVLAFSSCDCGETAQAILEHGVSGFLVKEASLEEVIVAIRAIHAGRIFISHSQQSMASPHLPSTLSRRELPKRSENELSGREREVILMLAKGLTNKQVAENLYLSVKTVETYRSRIMRKFHLQGRSDLFGFAQQIAQNQSPERLLVSPLVN